MSDIVYYGGEHSVEIDGVNSWYTYHLIPSTPPMVNPPAPKIDYMSIPGADGSLDYTEALNSLRYEDRKGSWEFMIHADFKWQNVYDYLMATIHGKRFNRIILTDDPGWFYKGRLTVNSIKSSAYYKTITIDYILDPYKYPVDNTLDNEWKWDDLFDIIIYYGRFSVETEKWRNLYNPNKDHEIPVSFYVSSDMTINFEYPIYTESFHKYSQPNQSTSVIITNPTKGIETINLNIASEGVLIDNVPVSQGVHENFTTVPANSSKTLVLTCSQEVQTAIKVEFSCSVNSLELINGNNADMFNLRPGDNKMQFVGDGTVNVNYEAGPVI